MIKMRNKYKYLNRWWSSVFVVPLCEIENILGLIMMPRLVLITGQPIISHRLEKVIIYLKFYQSKLN